MGGRGIQEYRSVVSTSERERGEEGENRREAGENKRRERERGREGEREREKERRREREKCSESLGRNLSGGYRKHRRESE